MKKTIAKSMVCALGLSLILGVTVGEKNNENVVIEYDNKKIEISKETYDEILYGENSDLTGDLYLDEEDIINKYNNYKNSLIEKYGEDTYNLMNQEAGIENEQESFEHYIKYGI